jgi:hypothetical protein
MPLELISIDSITFDSEGGQSESTYICGWDEATGLTQNLSGGIVFVMGVPTPIYPTACPYYSGMVCKSVKIVPLGDYRTGNPYGYEKAEVKITWGTPKPEDSSPPNPVDIFSIDVSVATEAMSIKGTEYKWAVGIGSPSEYNVPVSEGELLMQKWIPTIELNLKCESMFRKMKLDTMRDLVGKVNSSTLTMPPPESTQFAAETVLFNGVQMETKFTSQGIKYVPRSLKFLIRQQSWNKFWCEEQVGSVTGSWQEVTPHPYETASFNPLFTD